MNKCYIAVIDVKNKVIKKYSCHVANDGTAAKIFFKTKSGVKSKKIVSIASKPALKIGMEIIILRYKDYDPEKHRVTIINDVVNT